MHNAYIENKDNLYFDPFDPTHFIYVYSETVNRSYANYKIHNAHIEK